MILSYKHLAVFFRSCAELAVNKMSPRCLLFYQGKVGCKHFMVRYYPWMGIDASCVLQNDVLGVPAALISIFSSLLHKVQHKAAKYRNYPVVCVFGRYRFSV